jgi:hypothetical protein
MIMKKRHFLCVLASLFMAMISCNKPVEDVVTDDPELGQFREIEAFIDMSKRNVYNEALLCNEWELYKVTYETYLDGDLTETKDITDHWGDTGYTLYRNHAMSRSDGGAGGTWLYSHNCLLMKIEGYYAYEVVKLEPGRLWIRMEDYPIGLESVPYFKDPGGRHCFMVFEYIAK